MDRKTERKKEERKDGNIHRDCLLQDCVKDMSSYLHRLQGPPCLSDVVLLTSSTFTP